MPQFIDNALIFLAVSAAIFYLGRLVFRQFRSDSSACPKGCGSCPAVDFDQIREEVQKKEPII